MTMLPVPPMPDVCWPVDVSCIPDWDAWDEDPDPEAVPPVVGVPTYSDEVKARAMAMAGETLRMLTGFRVGGCPITVRPCRESCGGRTWRTYPLGGFSVPWSPTMRGTAWLNVGCGCTGGGCGCTTVREVRLSGYVGAVTEVKVDGLVLDPDAYRLDRGGRLVRVDAGDWPLCQDLNLNDDQPGTWSVTYTPGEVVDGSGAFAAGVLTREYLKACTTGQCDLPDTVTQIVRAGITITNAPGAFPNGKTGLRSVDSFVERWNPHALTAPSVVWSPDVNTPR